MRQEKKKFTVYYHDIFDYPLTKGELALWTPGEDFPKALTKKQTIQEKNGFFFLKGKTKIVHERQKKEKFSEKKLEIASRASKIISFIPMVRGVFLTGALAMKNAARDSDIDFLIICSKGTLWISRLVVVLTLDLMGIQRRRVGKKEEKDRLCLNMWMDESDLVWEAKERSFYTAHEIAQTVPLVNKKNTFERLILSNKWAKDFWPGAVRIPEAGEIKLIPKRRSKGVVSLLNYLAFKLQYFYMKKRISREVVTPTKAIFHPRDWNKIVEGRLTT